MTSSSTVSFRRMSQPLRFSKGGRFTHSVESELIITGLYQCESVLWSWIGEYTKPCPLQIKTVKRAQKPDQSLGANVLECYDPASRSAIKRRETVRRLRFVFAICK